MEGIRRFQALLDHQDELLAGADRIEEVEPEDADALFSKLMMPGNDVERLKNALRGRTSAYQVGKTNSD